MKTFFSLLGGILCLTVFSAALPAGKLPDLIPREVLFGNPERTSPKLSPDGKMLAYLAPRPWARLGSVITIMPEITPD